MSDFMHRALLAITVTASLSACMPTTTTSTTSTTSTGPAVAAASVPATGVYLATSDNGFAVPAVPAEKVPDEFERQVVDYPSTEAPGTVVINPGSKHLYFITGNNKAIRYGIAVGAAGFQWSGEALVTNRRPWPTWTPPKEMIERKPELSKWEKGQPGGPTNPLGARALYLTTNGVDYGYRIHGTPDWWSIGKNASSGCIRMINQDVMDLYSRVPDGAKVIVLTADGRLPKGLSLPPPAPVKKKPFQPAPAVAQAEDAAALPVPAAVTAPLNGPMPAAPGAVLDPAAPVAPAPTPAAGPTPTVTQPTVGSVAPAAPAAPAAVTAPALTVPPLVPPSVTPAPAPAAAPAAPACAVPLVNGVCPKA